MGGQNNLVCSSCTAAYGRHLNRRQMKKTVVKPKKRQKGEELGPGKILTFFLEQKLHSVPCTISAVHNRSGFCCIHAMQY